MSLLKPLKRNVAVRILPEPEGALVKAPNIPSGNQIVEMVGAGPLADKEIQEALWLLVPRFRPNLPPGSVAILDSRKIVAVVEDYGSE
jgi:hypothetical protein